MKTNHQGQISVYLCAVMAVMLVLIITVLQGIRIWEGKAKCRQALHGAVASIQGDYQPDLFRRYHLLAVDATYYGRGEGYLEKRVQEYLDYNLNPPHTWYQYQVRDTAMVNPHTFVEDNLSDFHQQIEEYMSVKQPLLLAEQLISEEHIDIEQEQQAQFSSGMDAISERMQVSGDASEEEPETTEKLVTDKMLCELGIKEDLQEHGIVLQEHMTVEELLAGNLTEDGSLVDPRDAVKQLTSSPILEVVMPEQADKISKAEIDLSEVPSAVYKAGNDWQDWKPEMSAMEEKSLTDWKLQEALQPSAEKVTDTHEIYGIAYALDSFTYAGNLEKDEDIHTFQYEVEYLLMGECSDYDNLTKIARRLCLLRMLPNGAYVFTDSTKREEALVMAALILTPLGVPELAEPVSYVFLGCWAYGESLLEVKELFAGKSVPLQKNEKNWKLSLNGLKDLAAEGETEETEELGLDYEQYLVLMLAAMPDSDSKYYRMLDIMQLNIQETIPEFQIEHAVDVFTIQIQTEESGSVWNMQETGGYLEK